MCCDVELNKTYSWYHGDDLRIGEVVDKNDSHVYIQGLYGSIYKMKKSTFCRKVHQANIKYRYLGDKED